MTDLIKVFSFTGLSTLVKMLTSYVTIKVVASVVGPGGIALIGQLQNLVGIMTALGGGGINNGVVKYVAEHKDDETLLDKYIQIGLRITIIFSLILGAFLILAAEYFSIQLLLDDKYSYVFTCLGINLILISLNNYFVSILNGFKEFKKFVTLNIITSIVGLFFTVCLVYIYKLEGALLSLVTYQSIIILITYLFVRKTPWFKRTKLWGAWNRVIVKRYLSYSLMAVVSALTLPLAQLFIRSEIINNLSLTDAGYWEAMNRVSALYLMFITTSFTVYYLPILSEIQDKLMLRREIFKIYKIITPVIIVSLIFIYYTKDFVITLLFSDEFRPMLGLFFWQLLGDFFKIMSWILAFIMVAKSMTKVYIVTEVVFSLLFVVLAMKFMYHFGLLGITQAYCLNYFLYLGIMVIIFRKLLLGKSL